jgi:hypothetical protein
MTRVERKILFPAIKRVRLFNSNVWWELKWEVWDSGYQSHYRIQDEYIKPAQRALAHLPNDQLNVLIEEWARQHPEIEATDLIVKDHYSSVIVEEIVRRACIAAYRTIEW